MPNISALTDTIFTGLRIFIPVLILLKFTKLFGNRIDIRILVTATNWLLLFAATVSLILFTSEIFVSYYSQNEYEQFAVSNRIFGPYWFTFAIQASIYFLLPQMMWFKKVKVSIAATMLWALLAYALIALVYYSEHNGAFISFSPSTTLLSYLKSLIIFIALLAIVYFMLLKRERRLVSK